MIRQEIDSKKDNDTGITSQPVHIQAYDFLRILGMTMIFVNHCWGILPFKIPDFGARGVEIFFLLSGFLLTYNYYDRTIDYSLQGCIMFGFSRIRKFYGLHICTFLVMAVPQIKVCLEGLDYQQISKMLPNVLANITLIQSWIPFQEYYWGFNGVSWFLSSLLFCYCIFPVLLHFIKKINQSVAYAFILGTVLVSINIFQSLYAVYGRNPDYIFHIFPVYKGIEFFSGALLGGICRIHLPQLRSYGLGKDLYVCVAIMLYFTAVFECNNYWSRAMFVSIAILLLLVLACGDGKSLVV